MTQLFRIEMRLLKAGEEWEDTGDEPTTKEQAEAWAADYRRGLEMLYEWRVVPQTAESNTLD